MKLKDLRKINKVFVFKGQNLVGSLERTKHGSIFRYDKEYLQRAREDNLGPVAYTLPLDQARVQTIGDNLHPFFAGLLPEGRRLSVLISQTKTSADDLFSLLLASGTDCIGDVFVSVDTSYSEAENPFTVIDLNSASYSDLLEQSLSHTSYELQKCEFSIPGIQPKISAARLSIPISIANKKKAYFLKLAPDQFPRLVENEYFFMEMAAACGINSAKTQIVYDREEQAGLLVERFDRIWQDNKLTRVHQEDACQFLGRYPQDKYRLSMRQLIEGVERYVSSPIIDAANLLRIMAFSYIIANGDLHAKNVSLMTQSTSQRIVLTPAYDLLSTLPYGDNSMALELEGRNKNWRVKDFEAWGIRCGLRKSAVKSIVEKLLNKALPFLDRLDEIGLNEKQTTFLRSTMKERIIKLTG